MQRGAFETIYHPIFGPGELLYFLESRHAGASAQVAPSLYRALAAGIPWLTILLTILPMILQLFSGTGNLPQIIAEIVALLGGLFPTPIPPTPAKT
ncbi:MAG: hypothetical protein KGL39_25635 [Patescibacteria group bacterium]|nr:hypothetical protein [Patescibacteria group bacterium]